MVETNASFTPAHFYHNFSASIRHILFACVNPPHILCVARLHAFSEWKSWHVSVSAHTSQIFTDFLPFPCQVRDFISDFSVVIAIVLMLVMDLCVGLATPKLKVPIKFKVSLYNTLWKSSCFSNPIPSQAIIRLRRIYCRFWGASEDIMPGDNNIEDYCGLKDSESKDRVHFENFQNPWRNFVDCLYMIQSIRNWIDGDWVPHRLRYLRCPGNRMSCRHVTIKSHDTKMKGIRTQNVIHNGLRY